MSLTLANIDSELHCNSYEFPTFSSVNYDDTLYTLCLMLHSRLGPGNESLQNKARRSILTSKLYFVFVTKSTQQKSITKLIL